ncbi:MAG: twin-arginine translocase TatA/TatE family subunit [Aquihabitans sp.]
MNLGPTELIIVLVIVLVLFGGAKLPKLAKSLGEAQREFKKGSDEGAAESPTVVAPTAVPPVVVPPADADEPKGPTA